MKELQKSSEIYVKHTQRFNKERQTKNKVRNKVSTQKILPKDRC